MTGGAQKAAACLAEQRFLAVGGKQLAHWGKRAWRSSNDRLAWERLYQHMQIICKYTRPPAGCPTWMGDCEHGPARVSRRGRFTWPSTPGPQEVPFPGCAWAGAGGVCACQ